MNKIMDMQLLARFCGFYVPPAIPLPAAFFCSG